MTTEDDPEFEAVRRLVIASAPMLAEARRKADEAIDAARHAKRGDADAPRPRGILTERERRPLVVVAATGKDPRAAALGRVVLVVCGRCGATLAEVHATEVEVSEADHRVDPKAFEYDPEPTHLHDMFVWRCTRCGRPMGVDAATNADAIRDAWRQRVRSKTTPKRSAAITTRAEEATLGE